LNAIVQGNDLSLTGVLNQDMSAIAGAGQYVGNAGRSNGRSYMKSSAGGVMGGSNSHGSGSGYNGGYGQKSYPVYKVRIVSSNI